MFRFHSSIYIFREHKLKEKEEIVFSEEKDNYKNCYRILCVCLITSTRLSFDEIVKYFEKTTRWHQIRNQHAIQLGTTCFLLLLLLFFVFKNPWGMQSPPFYKKYIFWRFYEFQIFHDKNSSRHTVFFNEKK